MFLKSSIQPGFQKASQNANAQIKQRLDSVVFTDIDGSNINKMTFFFNEKLWSISEIRAVWNEDINDWETEQESTFDWTDTGYLRSLTFLFPKYGEGERIEYTYNSQNLGDSETMSRMLENTWHFMVKNTYKYDDKENIIELQKFIFDEPTSKWIPEYKEYAAYNEHRQQISWESYRWEDEWVGDEKEEYLWYAPNININKLIQKYIWNAQSQDWENYWKREQDFSNVIKITRQEDSYWNPQRGDWTGEVDFFGDGDLFYNSKALYTYDNQDREIFQIASKLIGGVWKPGFEYETLWSVDNGEEVSTRKGYRYFSTTTKEHEQELITRYSPYYTPENEKFTYRKEIHKINGDWQDLYEEEYVYNNSGDLLEENYWTFENNVKLAEISVKLEYNNDGKVSTSRTYFGNKTGEDDWSLNKTVTYEYDHNIPVKHFTYAGEELTPLSGNGDDYDFNVPVSDLIIFASGDYNAPYKLLHTYEYVGNGTDFDAMTRTFYYSNQDVGIRNVNKSGISIYPNPATNVININSLEDVKVSIYNVTGTKLMQTSDKQIDVSALASGIYIVDINGVKTKVIKR
jgi:hypothetical protein